jgi:Tol biopolymer transport system component
MTVGLRLSLAFFATAILPALVEAQPPTRRVNLGPGGVQGDQTSLETSMSADGRWIAFASLASTLVAGDTNGVSDIFVSDRWTGTTTRVNVGPGGVEAATGNTLGSRVPTISGDGRFVAFESWATNLVEGDTNNWQDVFVHDRQTGTTTRVSVGPGGVQGNRGSVSASISADGRFVAFESSADNLVAGDTNGVGDVFVHDRQAGTTTRVSVGPAGVQSSGGAFPVISGDGRRVAFQSFASDLVPGDTNNAHDVFVHDRQTGTTTRVSVGAAGEANFSSYSADISADGRFVAFISVASNLVEGDTNVREDVFVRDLQTEATTRVSVGPGGTEANLYSFFPALSADGRFVAFASWASNLVAGDTNNTQDVFVHDRWTATTRRVSVSGSSGPEGNANSGKTSISANGRWVAFESDASNLVVGDTNGMRDVFVVDRRVPSDVDFDGRADATIYRPASGVWYVLESGTQFTTSTVRSWGVSTDLPVPGDYDGDARMDLAVYRPATGVWYVLESGTQFTTWIVRTWGVSTDVPVPADYDGDGRTDFAVYRPSAGLWYVLESRAQYTTVAVRQWGVSTDVPVPGDYDGDGRADPAVYRPSSGVWYVLESGAQYTTWIVRTWGVSTDVPVAGDYDGDGRTDLAVYRPSTGVWYFLESATQYTTAQAWAWGESGDLPVPADFDGDRRTDVAVYRPSTGVWYVLLSSTGFTAWLAPTWGAPGDLSVVEGGVPR